MKYFALFFSMLLSSSLQSEQLDYSIKHGQFFTSEGQIPNGCFGQLMTELNGDNTVAAVFINRNSLRGCISANIPYPGGNEEEISYEIAGTHENQRYDLNVCESIPEGSMGQSCDRITVQFVNRIYFTPEQSLTVLTLEKVGEW